MGSGQPHTHPGGPSVDRGPLIVHDGAMTTTARRASAPDATDPELEQMMRAARVFAGVTAESIAQAGDVVTAPQLRVLVLASAGEPLNTTGVAAALHVHLSNASRICERLVGAGFLDRRESATDRRTVELRLTTAGEDLVATVMSHRREAFAHILARLSSSERATLTEGLHTLCDAAEEYTVATLDPS